MHATLEFTEHLVRRAVRSFWWRHIGWTFVASTSLLAACLIFLMANGDRSWLVGAFGATLLDSFDSFRISGWSWWRRTSS
jgi:hypothetical protein